MSDANPYQSPATLDEGSIAESHISVFRAAVLALVIGVVSFVFVWPSVPFSESVRYAVTLATWIPGTAAVLWIWHSVARRPRSARRMICFAIAGWTIACIGTSAVVSLIYALALRGSTGYMTPEEWVWCRAILAGMVLAIIPVTVVLGLSRDVASEAQRLKISASGQNPHHGQRVEAS